MRLEGVPGGLQDKGMGKVYHAPCDVFLATTTSSSRISTHLQGPVGVIGKAN
jgi:hypothetical protein